MAAQPTQSPKREDRSEEVHQLSDMVKNLLSEQEALKSRLAMQEEQLKQTFHAARPERGEDEEKQPPGNAPQRGAQRSKPKLSGPKGRGAPTSASQKDNERKNLAE